MTLQSPFKNIINLKFIITSLSVLAVIVLALSVIYFQHKGRSLCAMNQQLESEKKELLSEKSKLLLEHSTWSRDARVDKIAKNNLDMKVIKNIEVIKNREVLNHAKKIK